MVTVVFGTLLGAAATAAGSNDFLHTPMRDACQINKEIESSQTSSNKSYL